MLRRWRFWVLLTAFLTLPGFLQAAEITVRLNPYFEGGGITKRLKSLREMRMRQMIPQSKDFSCGAAALATLMRYYYGYKITELDAVLGMFKHGDQKSIKKRGFSLLDMKRYTQTLNYQGDGYKVPEMNLLKNLKIPVITIIETNNYKHFVVLRRTDDKFVYLSDPAWGNRKVSWENFKPIWPRKVIFVVQGARMGTPEGLYVEERGTASNLAAVLRKDILVGHRIALDPANAMIYTTNIPLFTIPNVVPGLGGL